jgi:hypothetical protein
MRSFTHLIGLAAMLLSVLLVAPSNAQDAKPNWGFNFWTHDYFTGDAVFVDASKTLYYNTTDGSESRPRTAQGLPIGGEAFTLLKGYNPGTYTLSYAGSGDLDISGMGSSVRNRRTIGNRTYADVVIPEIDGFLNFEFNSFSSSNPLRDLRLISPGYAPDTNQVVRNEFKQRVEPFSTIRFMDWNRTNSSVAERWDERRPADYGIQTVGFREPLAMGGMAYEHMIDIANELDKDVWFNVPHRVDDDYMRNMAQIIDGRLDPEHKVIMEFSNELWNFRQGPELGQAMIHPDWSWQDNHGQTLYYGAVAPKIKQMSDIFHEEFDRSSPDRLEIVLAGQSENRWHVEKALEWFEDQNLDPRDYIDAISSAPYFSTAKIRNDYTDLDSLMNDMVREGYLFPERAIIRHKDLADEYDMQFYAYEGGQHVWFNNVDDHDLVEQAQRDPRMAEAYLKYMALWEEHNPGGLFMHYTLTGGEWGLLKDMNQESSPKWDAVMQFLAGSGGGGSGEPPNHPGVILFSDDFTVTPNAAGDNGRSGAGSGVSAPWIVSGDLTAGLQSDGEATHSVARGQTATMTRTIQTTGYEDIQLELAAFQNSSTEYETLEDLSELSPNWSDFLRIRINTGDGWEVVLLDDGAWTGENTLVAAAEYAAEAGTARLTSTGLLSLPEEAWDHAGFTLEISIYSNQEVESWYIDRVTLSGTPIPEPGVAALVLLVTPLLGRRRKRRARSLPATPRCLPSVCAAALVLSVAGPASANDYYAAPGSSSGGDGSLANPWTNLQNAVNALNPGDTLYLRGGLYRPTSTVALQKSGTGSARITVRNYADETPILDGSSMSSGSILRINHADHVTVQGLRLQNSHNHGIHAYISDHLEILNNHTYNTWGPGIGVWGDAGNRIWSDQVKVLGNRVEKPNHVDAPGYDPDARWPPHEGITIARVSNFEVGYNEVWNGMKEGIDAKGPNRHGLIHRNYVHGLPRVAYYVDGWTELQEDITLRENIAHDTRFGFQVTSEDGREVRNINIEHNLVFDLTGDAGIMLSAYEPESRVHDLSVINNTIIGGDYGLLSYLPDDFPEQALRDMVIRNNILNGDYRAYRNDATLGVTYDHNLENLAEGFKDPAAGDYRLTADSPAIDAGHPDATYNDPDGSRNDIGAFYLGQIDTSIERWLLGGDDSPPLPGTDVVFEDHFNLHPAAPGPVGRYGSTNGWSLEGEVENTFQTDSDTGHAVAATQNARLVRSFDTRGLQGLALEVAAFQNPDANYETLEDHASPAPSWGDYLSVRVRIAGTDQWTTVLLDHGQWAGAQDALSQAWSAEAGIGQLTATGAMALPDWAGGQSQVEVELTFRGSQADEQWYLDRFTLFGTPVPEPGVAAMLLLAAPHFWARSRKAG